MLRSLKDLERYKVEATDGDIGHVVKFFIDDEHWVVRYLVVETTSFLEGHRVLISPISCEQADLSDRRFHLALTMNKVKNSPSINLDLPVSRQHEQVYSGYYGYPYYWGLTDVSAEAAGHHNDSDTSSRNLHLRSNRELRGYHVQGRDHAIGHIEDFIVDDATWKVRYLVVNTHNWWFGKHVLVAPQWASQINWAERKVYVDLSRQCVKDGPEWDRSAAIERDYETRLHSHFGHANYWPPIQQHGGVTLRQPHASSVAD